MPAGLLIAPCQQSIQLIISPLTRFFVPIIVKFKGELVSTAMCIASGFPLIIARTEAGMAGCFQAGVEGGKAGGDVSLRKAK
jgi:hypothetical protein